MSKYVTTFTIAFIAGCIAAGCITGFSEMGRYFLLLTPPLFISYVNVQEVSKCTSYSYHQFLVPSVDGYRYVKFNDEVFRLEASNKVIACEYNPEFKYGYCVEKGPTHL